MVDDPLCCSLKMGLVRKLIIAVFILSTVVFVALFGRLPAFRYPSLVSSVRNHAVADLALGKPPSGLPTDFSGSRSQACS